MENLSKSILKRIELIINTTDLTNPNEIIKLAIEQENSLLSEMMEQKTERSKIAFKTIMKKTYCTAILNS
jgi:excinuclease UvrABC helicase subunit UvrB